MIYTSPQLRLLIEQTLTPGGCWSANAEELLLATVAQESLMGQYRKQIDGPALGIVQMEPATHDDCWSNYIGYRPDLAEWLTSLSTTHQAADLETNDAYALAMARVRYMRAPGVLPSPTNLHALWLYYSVNYNAGGKATEAEFNQHYTDLVTDGVAR